MKNFLNLVMYFWDDGQENSDRIRNASFSWEKLKNLKNFLNKNNIDTDCKLCDFSKEKKHKDSVHIPFDDVVYEKSKKLNIILNDNQNYEYIMFVDCDVFFDDNDLNKILHIFQKINKNEIYVFDLAKLNKFDTQSIINNNITNLKELDYNFAYSGKKEKGPLFHTNGGLGGVFISNMNVMNLYGRFNESYTTWGGEDGDALTNIFKNYKEANVKAVRDFFPFHLYHFTDWGNKKYYNNNK